MLMELLQLQNLSLVVFSPHHYVLEKMLKAPQLNILMDQLTT